MNFHPRIGVRCRTPVATRTLSLAGLVPLNARATNHLYELTLANCTLSFPDLDCWGYVGLSAIGANRQGTESRAESKRNRQRNICHTDRHWF